MVDRCAPLVSLLLSLTMVACASTTVGGWRSETLFDAGLKLGGCAVGDLIPDVPGPEIAVVAQNGDVWVLRREDRAWTGERIASLPGEMIQCAIGEADAEQDGLQLAVVGMEEGSEESGGRGAAHVFRRVDGGWHHEQAFTDDALLHGVCCDNGAVYVTGFSRTGVRLVRGADGWQSELVAELPGAGKAAEATQFGVSFACTDGSVMLARATDTGWDVGVADKRTAGRSRLGSDGARVLVADDDGVLSLIGRDGPDIVYQSTNKLRGAVLAELDPRGEGLEAATAGYDHLVVVNRRIRGSWESVVIHEDPGRLHHLAVGDLHDSPGEELVTCGYSGQVLMLRRVE